MARELEQGGHVIREVCAWCEIIFDHRPIHGKYCSLRCERKSALAQHQSTHRTCPNCEISLPLNNFADEENPAHRICNLCRELKQIERELAKHTTPVLVAKEGSTQTALCPMCRRVVSFLTDGNGRVVEVCRCRTIRQERVHVG